MALLEILHYPDPRLRKVAAAVTTFDAALRQLADDMLETMYAAPGIGLAATQVNVHKRLLVVDVSSERESPLCLVNPRILEARGEGEMDEGCLSVPGTYEAVRRPEWVRVAAQDVEGQPFEFEFEGLLAVCVQHEMDHLEGKLFVDRLSPLKRSRIRRKFEKAQRQAS